MYPNIINSINGKTLALIPTAYFKLLTIITKNIKAAVSCKIDNIMLAPHKS